MSEYWKPHNLRQILHTYTPGEYALLHSWIVRLSGNITPFGELKTRALSWESLPWHHSRLYLQGKCTKFIVTRFIHLWRTCFHCSIWISMNMEYLRMEYGIFTRFSEVISSIATPDEWDTLWCWCWFWISQRRLPAVFLPWSQLSPLKPAWTHSHP